MATVTKTFTFNSDSEGFSYTNVLATTGSWSSGILYFQYFGITGTSRSGYWYKNCTWEDLGVPTNSVVTSIQFNGSSWNITQYGPNVTAVYLGAHELRDGAGANPVTLLAEVQKNAVSSGSLSAGTDQNVPSAIQASNSSIQLRLNWRDIHRPSSCACTWTEDNISYIITYGDARIPREGAINFQNPAIV